MNKKWIISFLSLGLLAGCQNQTQKLSIIELVPESDRILEGEKTRIDIKTDPAGTKLADSNFDAGKGEIEAEDGYAMFSADEAGTYTIKASKDGIESNPVTIEVVSEEDQDHKDEAEQSSDKTSDSSQKSQNQKPDSDQQNTGTSEKTDSGSASSNSDSSSQNAGKTDNSGSSDFVVDNHNPINTDLASVMNDPEDYLNHTIDVVLMVPQDLPDSKQAVLPDGTKLSVLLSEDGKNAIPVLNYSDFDNWGVKNEVLGIFRKQNAGDYDYVLDVTEVIPQSVMSSANSFGGTYVGAPVSSMPSSGTFEFSANGINIRNGDQGLDGEKTGFVYNAGMSVHYDKVYQKDGYTWISYIGKSGVRRSAAVGNNQTLEYGFVTGN